MSSVLERLQKRRKYVLEIEGEPVHLRSLAFLDAVAIDSIEAHENKLFYGLGCALLNEDGTPAITPRDDGETAEQFAIRVKGLLRDIHTDVVKEITDAITKVTKPPSQKALEKNSEPTDSPAS